MTKKRNIRKIKNAGFKKKKVVARRKKLRKVRLICRKHDDADWLPLHTQARQAGRRIRKENRAGNAKPMRAVK
jgi:hypothetical protein